MDGVVIYNVECDMTLAKNLTWGYVDDEYYRGAYVFTIHELGIIKNASKLWGIKPAYYRKAMFDPDKDEVKITGQLEAVWK